jgi:CBS domain-containing protein
MHDAKIGCLPVVDDAHELLGVVTETDFLGLLVTLLSERPA